MNDHHLSFLLLREILDTGGQPELQSLDAVVQDPQLCLGASAHSGQQRGQLGATLTGRTGVVCQSLSGKDLQVHGGRAGSRRHWRQKGGMGENHGLGDKLTLPVLLLLLLLCKYLGQAQKNVDET